VDSNQPVVVPFNRPASAERSIEYVTNVLTSGREAGDGPFTKRAAALLSELVGGGETLLTTSCTHALEMAAILANVGPGDEVILPSFTFVSTANAFVLRGARPIFADISPDTLNIDPESVRRLVSERTKALCVVHYAGVGCDMDALGSIASNRGLVLIEDNAHGLFAARRDKPLGSFGQLATQSFHETKNVSTGEGGALIVNDESLRERAEIIREKGTNRSRFFRGQVDKYSWVDVGSSYLPAEVVAALLLAQLEDSTRIQARRHEIWDTYDNQLAVWASENSVMRPEVPADCVHPAHMYYLLMPDLESRSRFIKHLRSHGVLAVFHYLPLHLSEFAQRYGGGVGDCPVTEDLSDRLVRLPLFSDMTDDQLALTIATIASFQA
jgi:dTDP-4-amino-4,6-dideoxygalactose transaminase